MEDAVAEELKVGELMMADVDREVELLHQMSSSLVLFDTKRKRLNSHFDSVVELIQRKQTEAMEAIRVEEEEAKARVERLRDERLEEQEKRFKSILSVKMKEFEEATKRVKSNAAEMEREINEVKMDTERMAVELCKKERESRRMAMELDEKKKQVDDLTTRIREDARLGVTCKRLTGENFAMREEVKSLTKKLENQEKQFNDVLKVKMKEVAEVREKIERRAAEKELEKQEKRFNDVLKVKMKEWAEERERIERRAAEKELEKQEKRFNDVLKVKTKEWAHERETIERRAAEKELEKQEKRFNDVLNVKMKEWAEEREKIERRAAEKEEKRSNDVLKVKMKEFGDERERIKRRAAEKEKEMHDAKMGKEKMAVELCEKEKEVNEMKKTVAELTARMQQEAARHDAVSRAFSDENLELREHVKLLTKQLELKTHPLKKEEQLSAIQSFLQNLASAGVITVCDPIKHPDPSGEDLFKLAREFIDDYEVATSNVSSALRNAKDKAHDLVTEALRFSYKAELEDHANESPFRACRIMLLEQLGHICPHVASQAREEACKVAVQWIAKLDDCVDKFFEISRFLRFLSSYDLASEFEDEILAPILYKAAIHEGTPDLCFSLGFETRISDFTKKLLKSSERLKALEYVSAFKLEKCYSVSKIVHEEMNQINHTCHNMLKEGGQGRAFEIMNFEMDSLREVIKRIKYLKCEGKYSTVNLEQRLLKLEEKKYFFKKRSANKPNHDSEHEPSSKKRCTNPGSSKLRESGPK